MNDGILEEICRAKSIQDVRPEVFKKWQQYLRHEIDPKLERLTLLEAESAQLKDAKKPKRETAA